VTGFGPTSSAVGMLEPVTMTRSASAVAPVAGAPGGGAAGACAKTRASAKKGSTTLSTTAARDNPDLLFILMSFSMVWLGLVLGIINILRGDKFFFHFFEIFLNGPKGPFAYA